MPTSRAPRPPDHLSRKASMLWSELNHEYLFESDALSILLVALENLDLADKAREQLAREGITIAGKRNPAADVLKTCHGLFLRSLRQLQLDVIQPTDRIGRPPGGHGR